MYNVPKETLKYLKNDTNITPKLLLIIITYVLTSIYKMIDSFATWQRMRKRENLITGYDMSLEHISISSTIKHRFT